MTDRIFRVIMKQDTTNEVHAYEGRWITFAEAAASAYRERNKMGLSWQITQISEVLSGNRDPLRKLAKHLSDSPESQVYMFGKHLEKVSFMVSPGRFSQNLPPTTQSCVPIGRDSLNCLLVTRNACGLFIDLRYLQSKVIELSVRKPFILKCHPGFAVFPMVT